MRSSRFLGKIFGRFAAMRLKQLAKRAIDGSPGRKPWVARFCDEKPRKGRQIDFLSKAPKRAVLIGCGIAALSLLWFQPILAQEQDTLTFDTPDFTLKLLKNSQTVAALQPKGAGGFDFTPADRLEIRSADGIGAVLNQRFYQIYTPPPFTNPQPLAGAVLAVAAATNSQFGVLDIRGSRFLPNSSVELRGRKLVTLYLGSQRLIAFVPPSLASSLNSGVSVTNPTPGGGRTPDVDIGFRSGPLPIDDVESGAVRTGYVIITPDIGPPPVATLTYGLVHNATVLSQASILPTRLTTDTALAVDVVRAAGRNLGIAVANAGGTAAVITMTLRNDSGQEAAPAVTMTVPAHGHLSRFITEMFPPGVIGSAFSGSVAIRSSVPLSVTALRFSGFEFSSVPIPVDAGSPVPQHGPIGGVVATMFPQFAVSGGWATTLALLNRSFMMITGRIDIFDSSGNPMMVNLNGQRRSTFAYTILANGSFLLSPRDANGQSPF